MIEYIKGTLENLNPTEAIVECQGIGYKTLISLQTYEALNGNKDIKIYIHHYLREDEELFYGFATKEERNLFRLLIGVSGIGATTARMMLSSLTSDEIQNAILTEDPCTARRSNQSILKEISSEYSLEGLMLKLKLQYVGHLIKELTHLKRP